MCTLGRVCGVLVVCLGACPCLSGRDLAALFGVGAVCRAPPPVSAVWFPAPPGWGLLVVCPLVVPFACPPPSVSFPCRLGRCFSGVVPGPSRLWWVGGGPCRRLGSLPLVFPRGGADACTPRQGVTLLYGPSICTRSVQMDLLCSQVLQPFPTPGSGTLWVAGESLRDRRVSCLPRWTVCPTRSPSLGPNRSTCRGECSWSVPLVTPPGRCHRGPLTNGPGRIPPYWVCSGGADTVTGGAPKPLRLGPSPASPVGPFRPAPLFAVRFAVVGVPSLRGGVVVVGGGGFSLFLAVLIVCVSPPPLVVVRRRCVCLWRGACACGVYVCVWCVVCGVWCAAVVCWWRCGWCVVWLVPRHSRQRFLCATPRHSWLGFAAGGGGRSSPLLAEVPGRGSPPLLAGFRCRRWCVVCGVWCVACGVRRWRVWWVCGWCVVWLVPRHSWRRFPCATPRDSWLGFAAGGGVGLPATPGWGPQVVVVCFAGGGVLCCVCLCSVWVCAVAVLCCVLRVCGVCVFGGVVWWCGGCVFLGALPLGPGVCVCAVWTFVLVWVAWGAGGSCAVWLSCVRVCVLAVCGWWGGVCHTLAGSRRRLSAWFKKQKKRSCRCVAEMRGMRDA